MKFKVTYSTGLVEEVEQEDATSLDSFINTKFGLTADEVKAQGTTVEDLNTLAETPPAETPPAETPPAETPPAETPPAETPAA